MQSKHLLFVLPAILPAVSSLAFANESDEIVEAPIAKVLAEQTEDVRVFNDHLITLASPFMEGRVPGSRGMEVARDYVEYWMRDAGLEPAFDGTYRQEFPLAGTPELTMQELLVNGESPFTASEDFTALSLGKSGSVTGNAVYVGYSIAEGPDGYTSYPEGTDLAGKIAVMFRFEPMDGEGKSKWADEGWSPNAGFGRKVRAAAEQGAAGIVIINPPGTADERAEVLSPFSMGGSSADVPVFMAMPSVAAEIFGTDPLEMRKKADESGRTWDLDAEISLACEIERRDLTAQNVGGLIPGVGALANEIVIVGAHMDHLGMGFFGSRDPESAGKRLHPGADDNASGTAGILIAADHLVDMFAELPADQPRRTVLFLAFDAEESGLNGARYYVQNPIVPIEDHALMMNFDMIGRIVNKRLAVSGVGTAKGMDQWIEPIFEDSPLDVQPATSGGGGSDHLAFLSVEVPALFGIIADFHQEYHTPLDTSDKINRVDAVLASYLWRDIAFAAATRTESFEFDKEQVNTGGRRGGIKVRFGIQPAGYDEGAGVAVARVTANGAAEAGGVKDGDILKTWNGEEIDDVRAWMGMLAEHEPGDAVMVGVERGDETLELRVVLQAPGGGR